MARSSQTTIVYVVVGASIALAMGFVAAAVIMPTTPMPGSASGGSGGASPDEVAGLRAENDELARRLEQAELAIAALETRRPDAGSAPSSRAEADKRIAALEARLDALGAGRPDPGGARADTGGSGDPDSAANQPSLDGSSLGSDKEFDSAVREVLERIEEEERIREEAEEYAEDLERYQEMTTYLTDFVPARLEEMSTVLQLDASQRERVASAMELRKNQMLIRMNPDTPNDDPNRMGWRDIRRSFDATMYEILNEQQQQLYEDHDFDDFD